MAGEPIDEAWIEHLGAGDGEGGCGHAEQHIEMQEMLVKALQAHLPALGAQPAGELAGAGLIGAPAAMADEGEAGADDMDIAALQRAG